jgi:hypothetical protein
MVENSSGGTHEAVAAFRLVVVYSCVLALHKKSLFWDFSVQPLCPLCLCGVALLGIHQPQRHRGCTEKSAIETFCAKPIVIEVTASSLGYAVFQPRTLLLVEANRRVAIGCKLVGPVQ